MKTISIIIPTYGCPTNLAELLKSLINQSHHPNFIHIVDDTPTNEIQQIVEKFKSYFNKLDVNLCYFRNNRNSSISTARNLGVDISEGEILLFLDSDIILHRNYLKLIFEPFIKYTNALGVQGWIINRARNELRYKLVGKIFKLEEYSVNSCKFGEYPGILTKIIPCEYLSGSNMAIKRHVFEEGFKFNENLKAYSFMEDLLFSHSIYKKYPGSLFITPYAKCTHTYKKESLSSRARKSKFKNKYRKYVLKKLFNWKGHLLYYRQTLGLLVINMYKLLFDNLND